MTGVGELVEVRLVPPVPDQVGVSVVGGVTQLDVSLPLDAPLAGLLPEMAKLVRSRDVSARSDDAAVKEAKRDFWVLWRADDDEPLSPDITLREAGITSGALLRLTAERALAAPTLYDDVVDAAARLNRASYASWGPRSAEWMAFVGVHLASLVWAYLLVADVFAGHRAAMVGLSTVAALALVGGAALAERSFRSSRVAAALGWAAIPIGAGIAWATLSPFGGYGLAIGCVVLIVVFLAMFRAIGTGHWAYVASALFLALGGCALALAQAGVRVDLVGCGLAVLATVGCLTVPTMTSRLERFTPRVVAVEPEDRASMFEDPLSERPTEPPPTPPSEDDEPPTPTAEFVWARVRSAMITRSASYAALAAGAAVGAAIVLHAQTPAHWSGLAFALAVAVTLGLYARRPATAAERAALVVPAVALGAYACRAAQGGAQPMPLVAFGVLVVVFVAFTVVAMRASADRPFRRTATVLPYVDYLLTGALLPLAVWVAGGYERLGL